MRFFKYLILILIFIPFFANAYWYRQGYSHERFPTAQDACIQASESGAGTAGTEQVINITSTQATCTFMRYGSLSTNTIFQVGTSCVAGATNVYSGSVTVQNFKDDSEYLDLTDAAASKFAGTTVCASNCIHSFDYLGNGEGDSVNGPVVFQGKYTSTTQSCTSPTSGPTDTLNGTKTPTNPDDPDDPKDPDDPDNPDNPGQGEGSCNGTNNCNTTEFDDSGIISAINSMSSAIVNKLTGVASQITGSISQMSASVTDAIGVTNGKLDQVKAEVTKNVTATNAVKSAVDDNTSATNSVKTAVDANTAATNQQTTTLSQKIEAAATSVKNAVSEMSASITDSIGITNGKLDQVKAEIAQQKASIDAVKSAVDSNTNAVNANGDKVKTAVDSNTAAVNANGDKIKGAVDANTTAVNANGDKIKGAVDGNTEAVKEGNGILQDIKNWLTGDVDTSGFAAQAPQHEIEKQSFKTDIFRGSAQCPQDRTLSLNLFAGRSFQKTFSFQMWCDYLAIFGNLILLASYCYGALIVTRNS